jgi:hypothetical protein
MASGETAELGRDAFNTAAEVNYGAWPTSVRLLAQLEHK